MTEWREKEHPRDPDGKFAEKDNRTAGKEIGKKFLEEAERIAKAAPELKDLPRSSVRYIDHPIVKKGQETDKVQELTGVDWETAKKLQSVVWGWTSSQNAIRSGKDPEGERLLEEFISKSPKYKGTIYRGVSFDREEGDDVLAYFAKMLEKKIPITMDGISSWTSSTDIAEAYAGNGRRGIIFEIENKSGAPAAYLSKYPNEQEIIQSKKARYRIKSIEPYKPAGDFYDAGWYEGRFKITMEEV